MEEEIGAYYIFCPKTGLRILAGSSHYLKDSSVHYHSTPEDPSGYVDYKDLGAFRSDIPNLLERLMKGFSRFGTRIPLILEYAEVLEKTIEKYG